MFKLVALKLLLFKSLNFLFVPSDAVGTAAAGSGDRNGIKIKTQGVTSGTTAEYGCDSNDNGMYDERDDGVTWLVTILVGQTEGYMLTGRDFV